MKLSRDILRKLTRFTDEDAIHFLFESDDWTAQDVLECDDIHPRDRLIIVLSAGIIAERIQYAFACACVETVLSLVDKMDERILSAVATRRAWLQGDADDAAMLAAQKAADDAVRLAKEEYPHVWTTVHAPPLFYYSHMPVRDAVMQSNFAKDTETLLRIWQQPKQAVQAEVATAIQAGYDALIAALAAGEDGKEAAQNAARKSIYTYEEAYFRRDRYRLFAAEVAVSLTGSDAARAAINASESEMYAITGELDDFNDDTQATSEVREMQIARLKQLLGI